MNDSRVQHHAGDENMENLTPGKRIHRLLASAANRPILKDLTPNASMSSRTSGEAGAKKSMSLSPLKRARRDVFGDDKGFTYLKRRRLSQSQSAGTNTPVFRRDANHGRTQPRPVSLNPLSPRSSTKETARVKSPADKESKESDEDSGRESQNSNNTRGSFDSLINYDPSQQQALASQALNFVSPSVAAHTTFNPALYSTDLSDTVRSRAETLRMRLKVAIYKVRTNQINVPFSRLRVPEPPTPAPITRAHPSPPNSSRQPPSDDPLPTPVRTRTTNQDEGLPYGLGLLPAPDMTPNVFSNRFMPMQRAPSSSPPFIHIQPSSLPRHAMTRDTSLMGNLAHQQHDHDSLDSEATELAEDMHDGHEHAESPTQARRGAPMFAAGLPR